MRGLSSNRGRALAVAALLPLAAAACTSTGGGGSASAVSTSSTFSFPSGTAALSGVQQPLDVLQLAPSTTWSQTVDLTSPSTGVIGTSEVSIVGGGALNADGTLPATVSLTVTASGTGSTLSNIFTDPITGQNTVTCTSTSTATTCSMPVTLPAATAASPVNITVNALGTTPQGGSTSWWTGGIQIGNTVWAVGFVTIPGAGISVDPSTPVTNQTVYNGSQTTCSAVPVSNVQWLSPADEANAALTAGYGTSSPGSSTCPVTFTALSPGNGVTGVQVTAPT